MYEISVIKSAINLYRHLYDINIKGNKRINKYKVILSIKTIYNVLHHNNLTYKKIKIKNVSHDAIKINNLKKELKMKMSKISDENIINLDEIAVYLNEKPTHGGLKKVLNVLLNQKINK